MTTELNTIYEMVSHFQQVTEREKSGLARELHDDLGGYLIGAVMDLTTLAPDIPTAMGAEAHNKMTRARQALASAIALTRRLTEQLRPTLLDNVGLFTALRWQLKNACERTHIKCSDDLPTDEPRLTSRASIALFRSAQEALIVGIDRCSVTELELVGSMDDKQLYLRFAADGGLLSDRPNDVANLMLQSLRHRIRTLGGAVQVENPSSGGIVVAISAPTANVAATH
jgi:signal transduction histidine kinase